MRPPPFRPVMAWQALEDGYLRGLIEQICDPDPGYGAPIGVELRMRAGRGDLPVHEPPYRLLMATAGKGGRFEPWSKVMLESNLSGHDIRALATIHEHRIARHWGQDLLARIRQMCSREDGGSEVFSLTLTRYGAFVINESLHDVPTHENTTEEVARFVSQREQLLHRPCRDPGEIAQCEADLARLSDLFNTSLSVIREGFMAPIDLKHAPVTRS